MCSIKFALPRLRLIDSSSYHYPTRKTFRCFDTTVRGLGLMFRKLFKVGGRCLGYARDMFGISLSCVRTCLDRFGDALGGKRSC